MSGANRLAVDREALRFDALGGSRNRRQSRGPVISVAAVDPHRRAVPADDEPISVVLDLMHPIRTGRCHNRLGGDNEPGRETFEPHASA